MPIEIPADLPPPLLPLVWLLGRWEGVGVGGYPTVEEFRFGQEVEFGYTPGKPKVCSEMRGVVKGQGETSTIGERFNTPACDVSPSDVTSF